VTKSQLSDLAVFGGPRTFERVRSTSNLSVPDFETFLRYSRVFFDARRYSNDGPLNRLLEERLADFHGVARCVTFSSGFWGLVLAMNALSLPGRTEVIMPSLTYRRLADAAAWAGLTPRYCDIDPDTLAASPETMAPLVNAQTALLLGVHPIVNTCDASGLERLSEAVKVPLMIDSVESAYEISGGRRVGSFGACEVFSMHASKLLNSFEGGYVTTDDHSLADALAVNRGFGFQSQDNATGLGVNAKLNEVHAAMALASLDDIAAQVDRNRERYDHYRKHLDALAGVRLLEFDVSERPGFKNIVVDLNRPWPLSRAQTLAVLNAEGALARAYYSPPLHTKKTAYRTIAGDLPITDANSEQLLVLPSGHQVGLVDIEVITSLLFFLLRRGSDIERRLEREPR
jgi:dTDP-4-amino-4,6-dideoxygalactose transaminase